MEYNLDHLRKRLIKRKFSAVICKNKQDAANFILETFPVNTNTIIGMGNSLTLDALEIKKLWSGQLSAIYQHAFDSSKEETKKALTANLYLTSANAISYDGEIINIDGTGNRVAATCYGPDQIIYVIGKNKIAPTLGEAVERAKNAAAVQNAKRYNRKTPCVSTGKCENCLSPECICSIMTIHRKQPLGTKTTVILVNEEMGF